jgi:hypothetical protein
MSPGKTREQVIEGWMLAVATDGGIERFDHLHIDRIDEAWKEQSTWVDAALEAYRIAVALRNQHKLPFVVALGFSLESGASFETTKTLASRLDWSPPSLYLFHPGKTPYNDVDPAATKKFLEHGVAVRELVPAMFGVETHVERAYHMEFRQTGSAELVSSVFIEG